MLAQKEEDKLLKRLLNASDRERNSAKKKQAAELKKAEKQLVLVFLCQHRPVLQSCKHIGIQHIIADIVHGTLA